MRKFLPFVALLLLSGCGEARIDGSSPEAFQKSVERMQNGLSETENQEFSMALAKVIMQHSFAEMMKLGLEAAQKGEQPDLTASDVLSEKVLKELDGMTRAEVIEHANSLGPGALNIPTPAN